MFDLLAYRTSVDIVVHGCFNATAADTSLFSTNETKQTWEVSDAKFPLAREHLSRKDLPCLRRSRAPASSPTHSTTANPYYLRSAHGRGLSHARLSSQ